MRKILKIIFGIIYSIGACITLALSLIFLSRSDIVIYPDAMLPYQLYELAFIWLAFFGTILMIPLCYIVYKIFDIKNSSHYKRNKALIFTPGIICASCMVFMIGLLFSGMINSFLLH